LFFQVFGHSNAKVTSEVALKEKKKD
jgi:hypothetical protein